MGFREAVTVCIQDYYTFSGRARRPEFWWFWLFLVVVSFILSAIDSVIFGRGMLLGLNGLFGLLTFVPQLAVAWRRMHDTGRPGWFNLLPFSLLVLLLSSLIIGRSLFDPTDAVILFYFLVIISAIVILIWLALPSQSGENRFGPELPP